MCAFRGLGNLWVTDGSVFPTSSGVNPSLTIAANALRVGTSIAAG
jgi:choline dehydrogenase-like flavoprotein